jgi:acyl-coenzyme A thioesterase 13
MMKETPRLEVPEGFIPWPAKGPFLEHIAAVFVRGPANAPVFGVRLEQVHCNGRGTVHGGFISTLADVWAGYSLAPRLDPAVQFSTSSLTVDFMSSASSGEWLQSETDRIRIGKRICVVTSAIVSGERLVALTRATFVIAQTFLK